MMPPNNKNFFPLNVFIAWRYIYNKNVGLFTNFLTTISIAGVAISVALMIVVLSIMNGFSYEMQNRVLNFIPHLTIENFELQQNTESLLNIVDIPKTDIRNIVDYNWMQGLIVFNESMQKSYVEGVDLNHSHDIKDFIIDGNFIEISEDYTIAIGSKLASNLNIKVGDKVSFVAPELEITPAGVFPRSKRFLVIAIFQTNVGDIDANFVLTKNQNIAKFLRKPETFIKGKRFYLENVFNSDNYVKESYHKLPEDTFLNAWTNVYGWLYNAIQREKSMVSFLLLFVVCVAAFNIVSTLIMSINDKKTNVAILRTIGSTKTDILKIFLLQGVFISFIGITCGVIIGMFISKFLDKIISYFENVFDFKLLDSSVYFIDYIPIKIIFSDIIFISVSALILTLLSSIYPALTTRKLEPSTILRYE